jgi:hypothetical protein
VRLFAAELKGNPAAALRRNGAVWDGASHCGTIKKMADKEPWTMPATIEDPKALEEIAEALKGTGLGRDGSRNLE